MHRLLCLLLLSISTAAAARPTVTVVCVIDQLAQHLLDRHKPFLRGGIKKLLDNGLVYNHTYHPNAQPATATGHAGLSTGTSAYQHGIIANEWYTPDGCRMKACDEACPDKYGVFSPTGTYAKGKSADSMKAPTLSESCIRNKEPYTAMSISLKSRAAIPTAGKYGTPVWFDSKAGLFTSSTAFGPRLPVWARAMNHHLKQTLHKQHHTQWHASYPPNHSAYQHVAHSDYRFTGYPYSLIDKPRPLRSGRKPYFLFEQTPQSNKALLTLAELALKNERSRKPDMPIVLWLSLSTLDYVGHYYGPRSKETIDMLYHIDEQLGTFITEIESDYGAENCLWALTADHGILPIPEYLRTEGRASAQRLDASELIADLNRAIYQNFEVKNMIRALLASNMYLDHSKWNLLTAKTQENITLFIKNYLHGMHGIKRVWDSYQMSLEMRARMPVNGSIDREQWFDNQYYHGRSGDFIIQVEPYSYLTHFPKGTSHDSPYDYDVRVPLILYSPGNPKITPGIITTETSILHLPTTLAHLLEVQRPALAPTQLLPGIS